MMQSTTHFQLDSVEQVKATLTITATIADWRLLMEGSQLYKSGSEEWYRWTANALLQDFACQIRALLREAEKAQLTSAHRTAAVLDNDFEPRTRM